MNLSSAPPPAVKAPAGRWKACGAALLCLVACVLAAAPEARAQATGNLMTKGYFNSGTGQAPYLGLTLGNDGNFYGTAPGGGANNLGTFFRVTPDGTISLLYSFTQNMGVPTTKLVLANDGNFYGITANGMVLRLMPDGTVSTLYSPVSDSASITTLVQGSDGALYGTTQYGGNEPNSYPQGDGTIFRLTLTGNFAPLYAFRFHQTGNGGYGPTSALVSGTDGNLYGVTAQGGANDAGVIYQLTTNGTVTTLYSFDGQKGSNPAGPLIEGNNGVFYGVTTAGGNPSGNAAREGTVFSINTANGTVMNLHNFTASEVSQGTPSGFIKASDGSFYLSRNSVSTTGTTSTTGTSSGIYQITTAGVVTPVYQFNSTTDDTTSRVPVGPLAQAGDGSFYGVTTEGGVTGNSTAPTGAGTVFQLVVSLHPPFFNGEKDLSNGVKYLDLSDGHPFGYYAFLSDPHYIYHFDLGYEYVFDAADGNAGVYLYDFTSQHFFYTNPASFPYLYDFTRKAELYYYPDPSNPGRYNTNGTRYFFQFNADGRTGMVIVQ